MLQNLRKELPVYLAEAADLDRNVDPVQWWKNHPDDLLFWSAAAAKILLVQPSLLLDLTHATIPTSEQFWFLPRCFTYRLSASFNNVTIQQEITELPSNQYVYVYVQYVS